MPARPIRPIDFDPATVQIEVETPPESDRLPEPVPEPPPPRRRTGLRLFLGAGGLLLAGLLGLEAWRFVEDLFERSLLLGGGFALLIGLTAAGAATIAAKELQGLLRLGRLERWRGQAERLMVSEVHGEAAPLLDQVRHSWRARPDIEPLLATFDRQASDALADGERLQLFARTVLHPLDRRAYREVVRTARDVGGLTALSPLGILDGLVVLAHTLGMLRRIATL